MIQKEVYEELLHKGHLSDVGLRHYISILKGEVIDYTDRIKATLADQPKENNKEEK